MFTKFYENVKKYIKENYSFLLFLIVTVTVMLWPVDYYIMTGGGTMDIDSKVKIEDSYKSEGSLNFAYVKETKGTVTSYLLSYVMPGWTREDITDYKISEEENIDDLNFRSSLDLKLSNDYAIRLAYEKAKKEVTITESKYYVYYKDEKAKENDLKVGDQILEYDNNKIESTAAFKEYILTKQEGDIITFKILRNDKEKEVTAKLYSEDHSVLCGVVVTALHEYETDPEVTLSFKESESGPSGGLMLTLAIYNKLTKEDLTKGLTIVGTGTVEEDGSAGDIGGVAYKLQGAVKSKADVFIVPNGNNYKDAIKEKKKHNYEIKIIGVDTVDDAIEELKKL